MEKLAHHRKREDMPMGEQVTWGHWSTSTSDVVRNSLGARSLGLSTLPHLTGTGGCRGSVGSDGGPGYDVVTQWSQRLSVTVCLVSSNTTQLLDQIVGYRFYLATGGLKQGLLLEDNQAE